MVNIPRIIAQAMFPLMIALIANFFINKNKRKH